MSSESSAQGNDLFHGLDKGNSVNPLSLRKKREDGKLFGEGNSKEDNQYRIKISWDYMLKHPNTTNAEITEHTKIVCGRGIGGNQIKKIRREQGHDKREDPFNLFIASLSNLTEEPKNNTPNPVSSTTSDDAMVESFTKELKRHIPNLKSFAIQVDKTTGKTVASWGCFEKSGTVSI